jgi:hypothetical protein
MPRLVPRVFAQGVHERLFPVVEGQVDAMFAKQLGSLYMAVFPWGWSVCVNGQAALRSASSARRPFAGPRLRLQL